jgi:anthranilate synthase component 1
MVHTIIEKTAIYRELPADFLTPAIAFQALYEEGKGAALLESLTQKGGEHYSFLGLDPIAEFSSRGLKCLLKEHSKSLELSGDPLDFLREALNKYSCSNLPYSLSLAGGAVGFLSYDAVRLFEHLPDQKADPYHLPDLLFHFYEKIVLFDHSKKTVLFAVLDDSPQAKEKLEQLIKKAHSFKEEKAAVNHGKTEERVDVDDAAFEEIVKKAKGYLQTGDVFQVVCSRTFSKKYTASPLSIYLTLRRISPSPYLFFLDAKDFQLLGSSPEKLVQLKGDEISTVPIAGTRKRGKTEAEDDTLAAELLADEKENAEHMMLVDLSRNDVGRVSEIGTVKVKSFKQVEKFSHLMHIVSEVTGKIRKDLDALDVLKALFPAGTLTGAPKIRAMEIIHELETSRRGVYGGAIVAIDGKGDLQSCIAIRMALLKDGYAHVRAGAGVVYDSDPKKEAEETRIKAKNVLDAIRKAQGEEI